MNEMLPGRYFISHSYDDEDVRNRLVTRLPEGVEPFIFEPIRVSPLEFVSSSLIGSILTCDGMIYLNEGFSAQSFWVAFEHDYALRSGKPVYSYTPSSDTLLMPNATPIDLAVFPTYSRRSSETVMPILNFMRQQRYFDVWIDRERLRPGTDFAAELMGAVSDTIQRGGYVTLFWNEEASQSEWTIREAVQGLRDRRLIVAGLDNSTPPDFINESNPGYFVQLVDENGLNNNRIDDLIIRLYWLMFRNQFPELVYD